YPAAIGSRSPRRLQNKSCQPYGRKTNTGFRWEVNMKTLSMKLAMAATASFLAMSTGDWAGEVVWWTTSCSEARAWDLVEKFQTANPDVTVKLEITTTNGLPQRILTSLQSGAAPDVIDVQHGWVNGYAQNNLILPVDDVLTDRDDYIPAALEYNTW